jgi:hypothetical protein
MIWLGKRRLARFGALLVAWRARDGRTLCRRSYLVPGWKVAGDCGRHVRGRTAIAGGATTGGKARPGVRGQRGLPGRGSTV